MSETVAETATAAENDEQEDYSMEKLQVEEEDEKNVSAEDLLGGKSLMMSDSENEEISDAKDQKVASKSRRQRFLDSDDEEDGKSVQEKVFREVDQAEAQISPISRRQRLPDSDDENEGEPDKAEEQISPKSSRHRFADINEEDEEYMAPKAKQKISAIIDTDSEGEQQGPKEEDKPKKKNKREKKKKQRMDTDSDSESHSHDESQKEQSGEKTSPAKNKLKGLVDSESEPEPSNGEESGGEQENATEVHAEAPKKAKAVRASAKKALDTMQAIQSEQQRLHREAHISVPYHQPKPRTLKEFLSRRTINTPLATAMAGGSPMPSKQPRKSMGLRMNREELEAYAKLMDDRAKEATEFFKSESEPDDEDGSDDNEASVEMKDNPGVMDEAADILDEVEKQSEEIKIILKALAMEEEKVEEPIASTSAAAALRFAEMRECLPEPGVGLSTKDCLVTEVIELPRLDLSTINTTPPSKPATPRISEAIRRLKIEKSTDVSPSLKGDATMLIDLETGDMFAKKSTGVDDLLQRLMKTREAKKHKTTETVNILSTAHGKLEMSKVNIHLHEEEPVNKDATPGSAYVKMQEQLKSRITQKRMEDLRKKQAEEKERAAEDDEEEGMDVDEDEEYEPDEKPCPSEVAINEDEEILEEGEETALDEADAEEDVQLDAEVEDVTPESENSSESEEESEPEEENPAGKKRNRIIRAFQDDDNSDEDDLDLLQTPKPPSNATPMTATQLQLSAHKLFDAETRRTASDEENELLDLCSGQFPQSQMGSSAAPSTDTALISQIPMTQFGMASSQAPEELESLCSGTFATQQPTQQTEQPKEDSQPVQVANKIVSSDEETKEEPLETEKPRNKKLTKKKPKKRALGFSDDEESDAEDCDEEEVEPLGSDSEPVEEIPETFVDYDSEENEIVVEMTKKDRKLRASNFMEKEAELSESEWGSADEDEKNMDTYDIELGDEDEFDREKLRSELGQIHARKMLDQDIREVRQIKEMLFEDEEGAVRQRQFRWKNVDSGFSLEDQQRTENGEANEGSGDEENEHMWRKIRYEREQLLLENGLKAEGATPLSPAVANNTSNSGNSIRRLNIITAKKTTVEMKKSSPFLISKTVTGRQQKGTVRGSFLVRDNETLTKLAGFTKGGAGDVDGTAGTVSVKTARAKNFVFATLTEEEHENQKRKAADLLNSSSETGVNFMKKPRLEPRREKCLIDQLL
ncbi:claspin [Drosophila miranda]|uniref:claspin n=1 Tax=Drosophila miranda TaxID=7229 RepID=UPI0007E6D676|nr:claspin [Drosophila miranda]